MKLPELWKEDVFWKYVLESTTDKEFRELIGVEVIFYSHEAYCF